MNADRSRNRNTSWLGVVAILFGILLLANNSTEFLKQLVLVPGSTAEQGVAADCRPDELEEEGLSLRECELMVSSVQITLASSPGWFRQFQLALSLLGSAAAIASIVVATGLVRDSTRAIQFAKSVFIFLLALDLIGFIAATNTGPLLRAQYLWTLLLWICIHITLVVAIVVTSNQLDREHDS